MTMFTSGPFHSRPMKFQTYRLTVMKAQRMMLTVIFLMAAILVSGQTGPKHRPVTKEVQKISNKKRLNAETVMTVRSVGNPSAAVSKAVQLQDRSRRSSKKAARGNMVSRGYPELTISKGVYTLTPPSKTTRARFLSK